MGTSGKRQQSHLKSKWRENRQKVRPKKKEQVRKTDIKAQAAEIAQAAQETIADIEVQAAQQVQSAPEVPATKEMSTMKEVSANQKAKAVAEVEETEPKTVESPVEQTPQPAPRRMSGPIGSSHVMDPGDPLFGLTPVQQVLVSRYPGSGGSTSKSLRSLDTSEVTKKR